MDTNKRMGGWEEVEKEFNNIRREHSFQTMPWAIEFIKEKIDLAHSEGFKEGVEKAVECVEELEMKHGFMPLGVSEDPWNAALKKVGDALRDLLAQDISSKRG